MAHRRYEDALHLDLRRGLSNAKRRLDEVILERDQYKASSDIFEHRWKAMEDKCASLAEVLKLKQAEMMELTRETDKLRFLIGAREVFLVLSPSLMTRFLARRGLMPLMCRERSHNCSGRWTTFMTLKNQAGHWTAGNYLNKSQADRPALLRPS